MQGVLVNDSNDLSYYTAALAEILRLVLNN